MKRVTAFILSAAMALTAAGCQKTPEDPIVAGKSSNDLIEKAAAETAGTLAERVNAPERYQTSFSSTGSELNVTVDAAVTVPEADKVPIIRVTPTNITQEQADVLMDKLVQGELYEFGTPKTKAEIADEIVAAKQKLAQGPSEDEANTAYFDENGEMTWEEYMDGVVDRLQEEYDTAPETAEKQLSAGRFAPLSDDGRMRAGGENTTDELGWETLDIVVGPEGTDWFDGAKYIRAAVNTGYTFDYMSAENFSSFFLYSDVDISSLPDVTVTAEDAQALCDDVVQALGIPSMTLYAVEKKYGGGQEAPRCCWELQYTRNIGGVPLAYSSIDVGIVGLPQEGEIFKFPWTNERLSFYVNDDGIVGMYWVAPYALGETVAEDAALMSFADIMDIFEKMYVVQNDGQPIDVTIDSIRLSYMRVSEQDKNYSGLLVPVWDFNGPQEWHTDDGESSTYYDPDSSLLTINAIDGTVIDRSLGY